MKRIDKVYSKLKELAIEKGISAKELAEVLGLSRANVSSDLNKLCRLGKVTKTNGRPVLFRLKEDRCNFQKVETSLDRLVKVNESLTKAVEQAKAAILYPPKGMHTLILGETGVGKTMFAGLMHKYAIEVKRLSKDSPFITFNCADYSNNPQLLVSQLFGVKKGAYTGADSDKVGLLEKASGGILFLDEVHRLPAEGQEMLFTFIDKGIFRRLGETDTERKVNVLLICATTEEPESTLLRTFTRRIPMIIMIPPLRERSFNERFNLIISFLREESYRLDKPIKVSTNAIRAFLSYDCHGNIGQLKADIQLACAKSYAEYVYNKRDAITISSADLPFHIKEGLNKKKEYGHIWDKLIRNNNSYYVFDSKKEDFTFEDEKSTHNIYDMIDRKFIELKNKGISDSELEKIMEKGIEEYFTQYIYGVDQRIKKTNLRNIIDETVINIVEDIVKLCEKKLNKALGEKVFFAMALHINTSIERIKRGKKIVNPQLNKIRVKYKEEFNFALDCIRLIERKLNIYLPIDEAGFLTMFFVLEEEKDSQLSDNVSVVVIMHGSSGATSLAEVANKLLDATYAVGINAPLDVNPQIILEEVKKYVYTQYNKTGFLFLVDMGSLTTFGQIIESELKVPVKVIPFVSTPHVIEATRKAMMGYSLDEIYNDVISLANYSIEEPKSKKELEDYPKLTILTVCLTGEGSAVAIKNFLDNNLKVNHNLFEIIPINLVDKEDINLRIKQLYRNKEIICIISSFKIDTTIPQYSIDDVLDQRVLEEIKHIINTHEVYYKMGKTLKYHLQNVDEEKVFKDVRDFIMKTETKLERKLSCDVLVGVALHMSCMIDRLKIDSNIVEYPNKEEYILQNKYLYSIIKGHLKPLEEKYQIKISEDEICYIMKFFNPDNLQ